MTQTLEYYLHEKKMDEIDEHFKLSHRNYNQNLVRLIYRLDDLKYDSFVYIRDMGIVQDGIARFSENDERILSRFDLYLLEFIELEMKRRIKFK